MNHRIIDERLAEIIAGNLWPFPEDRSAAFAELQQSRALISQLQAHIKTVKQSMHMKAPDNGYQNGVWDTNEEWFLQLEILLSAHGSQGEKA